MSWTSDNLKIWCYSGNLALLRRFRTHFPKFSAANIEAANLWNQMFFQTFCAQISFPRKAAITIRSCSLKSEFFYIFSEHFCPIVSPIFYQLKVTLCGVREFKIQSLTSQLDVCIGSMKQKSTSSRRETKNEEFPLNVKRGWLVAKTVFAHIYFSFDANDCSDLIRWLGSLKSRGRAKPDEWASHV